MAFAFSTTRRGLFAAALAYGAGAPNANALGTSRKSDPDVVRELLGVEELLIAVYRRVIATGLLSPRVERVARRVLGQELTHAKALTRALHQLAAPGPPPLRGRDAFERALSDLKVSGSLDQLHSEHDCVRLLLDLETAAQGAYYTAITDLGSLELTQLAVQILASEAQHQTAVSEARRPGDTWQAAPRAFVKGSA